MFRWRKRMAKWSSTMPRALKRRCRPSNCSPTKGQRPFSWRTWVGPRASATRPFHCVPWPPNWPICWAVRWPLWMIASATRWKRRPGCCKPGDVLLLENVRYYNEEEANDPVFAAKLAKVADIYVNDAFGAAHRAHASTEGVARVIAKRGGQCAAGLLMERELKFLGEELEKPARPFVVILGGAKVSDKIKVIDRLLEKADSILIGGAMAYTFRLAHGGEGRQVAGGTGQDGCGEGGVGQGQSARRGIFAADEMSSWPRR